MKAQLTCSIVQDLLPNYIDKLTSEETNRSLHNHLQLCDNCREIHEQMKIDVHDSESIPRKELHFFKKINRIRLSAALLCMILTLTISYLLYSSEFKHTMDKDDLSVAITKYIAPFEDSLNAYVLELKEMDGILIASFKDREKINVNGIAILKKGINQRYRIMSTDVRSSNYSSVVQYYQLKINKEPYYVISGYNLSNQAKYYGLDYYAYTYPGELSKDRVRKSITFDVENQQFLEVYPVNELDQLYEESVEETLYNPRLSGTSLYDANGNEITDQFIIQENNFVHKNDLFQIGFGAEKAEAFMIYVYIAIILGLGFIFTRYFLTDK